MLTQFKAVKYKGSMDAARQILAAEGFRSFFKGAGANILRGVAGAGVLSIYDRKSRKYSTFSFTDIWLRGPTPSLRKGLQGWLWLNAHNPIHKFSSWRRNTWSAVGVRSLLHDWGGARPILRGGG